MPAAIDERTRLRNTLPTSWPRPVDHAMRLFALVGFRALPRVQAAENAGNMMLRPFDDYHWQDHVPALGRIDLAVCLLVGLALPAFAMWDRPSEGRGPTGSIADLDRAGKGVHAGNGGIDALQSPADVDGAPQQAQAIAAHALPDSGPRQAGAGAREQLVAAPPVGDQPVALCRDWLVAKPRKENT